MTYNVLMTNPIDVTVQAILDTDADVVCLQETNEPWDDLLTRKLRPRYVHRVTGPHPDRWNGLSVFSKFQAGNVIQGRGPRMARGEVMPASFAALAFSSGLKDSR